jgi:hypothetical protein
MTPQVVLRDIALPALEVLTEPGEVTSVRSWLDEEGCVRVEVVFRSEVFTSYAWQPGVSLHENQTWLATFASELQDFIAESKFARGTFREYPRSWGDY